MIPVVTTMRWGGQDKPGRLGGGQENPKEVHCAQQDASTTLGVQYENNNICMFNMRCLAYKIVKNT